MNVFTIEETHKWFESRHKIYSLLSSVYRNNIANGLMFLKETPIMTILAETTSCHSQVLQESSQQLKKEFDHYKEDDSYLDNLFEEYNRLFVGPGHLEAPPWESVYTTKEKLLFGETSFKVRDFYRSFGLNIKNTKNEPEDHIALELAFMAKLCELYLDGQMKKDVVLQGQYQFLKEHLLKWVSLWSNDLINHAKTEFWRYLGIVTICWLEDDFKEIGEICEICETGFSFAENIDTNQTV